MTPLERRARIALARQKQPIEELARKHLKANGRRYKDRWEVFVEWRDYQSAVRSELIQADPKPRVLGWYGNTLIA